MALGILGLFFTGILFISIIAMIITLFSKNPKILKAGFIGTLILAGIVIFLTVTSLPTNYITQQLVGLLPGIPCLIAILMSFKSSGNTVGKGARIVACIGLASSVYWLIFL